MRSNKSTSGNPFRPRKAVLIGAAVAAATAVTGPAAHAALYNWVGGGGSKAWKTDANWDAGFGYPGSTSGDLTDVANIAVATTSNLTVNIDGPLPAGAFTTLNLGATDGPFATTITGSNGATLTVSTIVSGVAASNAGAVNNINIPFVMPAGNVAIGASTLNLAFTGTTFTNSGARQFNNNSGGRTVTIGNDILLSTAAGTNSLQFSNDATAGTTTVLNGVISNGAAASAVLYGRGTFEINGANTYTGNTSLGLNSPNGPATYRLSNNTPFGPSGTVTFGGASGQVNTLEAVGGARTIANPILLSRSAGLAGTNNFTFTNTVSQSGSAAIINNLSGGATATFSNSVFTATNEVGRIMTIGGTGTTIFSGVIEDSRDMVDTIGTLSVSEGGTAILTAANLYQGDTRILGAGRVQVGNGGTTGSITAPVVTGGTTGTGTFAVNRSDNLTLPQTLNGGISLTKQAANTLTITGTNFHTGANSIEGGTVVVNGGSIAETLQSNAMISANVNVGVIQVRTISGIDTAGLAVGQPVFIDGTAASAASYIRSIDSATQVTIYGTSLIGTGTAAAANVRFGAGAGLGLGNTFVRTGATLAGSGTLGGTVINQSGGTITPGTGIGTITAGGGQLQSGSTLRIQYDGAGAGTADALNVTGLLNIVAGATLDFDLVGTTANDPAYVIARYGSLTGTFTNVVDLPAGYLINYSYNDGASSNNIALVPIPEPASVGLLGLAAAGLLGRRCRRR